LNIKLPERKILMKHKKQLVVLSGAGISAESGLQTFRDSDGLWNGYDVYEVASPQGWNTNPQRVLDFYNARRRDVAKALPNDAHIGLAQLEQDFDVTVITQNIDDLHERAGSAHIIHLHGEIFKMRSVADEHCTYEIRGDIHLGDQAADGFQLRPHIVWFGEAVPMMEKAIAVVQHCDYFVVVGTSLQVYPAASLLYYAPPEVPKFIIDKKIPATEKQNNVHIIEMPATTGVQELIKMLKAGE
jgi:NAD-dependent deacetylase